MTLTWLNRLNLLPFGYPEGDESGGGDLNAGDTNPDGGNSDAGDSNKNSNGDANGGRKSGTPAGAKSGDDDPRIRGMLADLKREREARQKFERDFAAANANLEAERRRVRLLAGVETADPAEAEAEAIRKQFKQVINSKVLAEAMGMTEEDLQAFKNWRQQVPALEEVINDRWEQRGLDMTNKVVAEVGKLYGGDLSERQQARVVSAYIAEASTNPEFLARHKAGDAKLIAEFAKEFVEDWIEPAKRQAVSGIVGRQPRVPKGGNRSFPGQGGKKLDYNDPKAVEDAMVASFKEHGGVFGE